MSGWKKQSLTFLVSTVLMLSMMAPPAMAVDRSSEDEDRAGAMIFDLVLARPLGFAATMIGEALFVVSLPFTALTGNVGQAAEKLVVAPAEFTFDRPFGKFEE